MSRAYDDDGALEAVDTAEAEVEYLPPPPDPKPEPEVNIANLMHDKLEGRLLGKFGLGGAPSSTAPIAGTTNETVYTPGAEVSFELDGETQSFDAEGLEFSSDELEFLTTYDWGPTTSEFLTTYDWDPTTSEIPDLGDIGEEPFALLREDLVAEFGDAQGADLFSRVTAIEGIVDGSDARRVLDFAVYQFAKTDGGWGMDDAKSNALLRGLFHEIAEGDLQALDGPDLMGNGLDPSETTYRVTVGGEEIELGAVPEGGDPLDLAEDALVDTAVEAALAATPPDFEGQARPPRTVVIDNGDGTYGLRVWFKYEGSETGETITDLGGVQRPVPLESQLYDYTLPFELSAQSTFEVDTPAGPLVVTVDGTAPGEPGFAEAASRQLTEQLAGEEYQAPELANDGDRTITRKISSASVTGDSETGYRVSFDIETTTTDTDTGDTVLAPRTSTTDPVLLQQVGNTGRLLTEVDIDVDGEVASDNILDALAEKGFPIVMGILQANDGVIPDDFNALTMSFATIASQGLGDQIGTDAWIDYVAANFDAQGNYVGGAPDLSMWADQPTDVQDRIHAATVEADLYTAALHKLPVTGSDGVVGADQWEGALSEALDEETPHGRRLSGALLIGSAEGYEAFYAATNAGASGTVLTAEIAEGMLAAGPALAAAGLVEAAAVAVAGVGLAIAGVASWAFSKIQHEYTIPTVERVPTSERQDILQKNLDAMLLGLNADTLFAEGDWVTTEADTAADIYDTEGAEGAVTYLRTLEQTYGARAAAEVMMTLERSRPTVAQETGARVLQDMQREFGYVPNDYLAVIEGGRVYSGLEDMAYRMSPNLTSAGEALLPTEYINGQLVVSQTASPATQKRLTDLLAMPGGVAMVADIMEVMVGVERIVPGTSGLAGWIATAEDAGRLGAMSEAIHVLSLKNNGSSEELLAALVTDYGFGNEVLSPLFANVNTEGTAEWYAEHIGDEGAGQAGDFVALSDSGEFITADDKAAFIDDLPTDRIVGMISIIANDDGSLGEGIGDLVDALLTLSVSDPERVGEILTAAGENDIDAAGLLLNEMIKKGNPDGVASALVHADTFVATELLSLALRAEVSADPDWDAGSSRVLAVINGLFQAGLDEGVPDAGAAITTGTVLTQLPVEFRVEVLGALVGADDPADLYDALVDGSSDAFTGMAVWAQNEVLDFLSGAALATDYEAEFLALDSPEARAEFLTQLDIPTDLPLSANSTFVEEGIIFALLQSFPPADELVGLGVDGGGGESRFLITAEGSNFTIELWLPNDLPRPMRIRFLKLAYELSALANVETPDAPNSFLEGQTVDDLMLVVNRAPPHLAGEVDAAASGRSPYEGSMQRVSNYLLYVGNSAFRFTGTEFNNLIRHEFLHTLGIGSSVRGTHLETRFGESKWDTLTEPTGNPEQVKYFGIEGRKAYQRLYGLDEVPPYILIDNRQGGHLPTEMFSLMGQTPFGSRSSDYGPLELAMLKDLGYAPPSAPYNALFTPIGRDQPDRPNPVWSPENALTSANGKYTAVVSDTDVITVYETDQDGEIGDSEPVLTFGQAGSGTNVTVTLTTDGQLIATEPGMIYGTSQVWSTGAPDTQHADQAYVLMLTNDGDLQVRRFVVGTWKNVGNKIGEVVWSLKAQTGSSTPD